MGQDKKNRCWKGYKPAKGKKPYSPGSCVKEWSVWLENRLEQQKDEKLQDIWDQTIDALEIGGDGETNALATSLGTIVWDARRNQPEIKGGTAVIKRLNTANIFKNLAAIPDMADNASDAEEWLNKVANDGKAGGASVADLFQKMFGEKFNDLSAKGTPDLRDDAKAEVPPQPPKPDMGVPDGGQTPDQVAGPEMPPPDPNMPAAPGQPPAAPMQQQQAPPQMPPPPMGAAQGMF